MDVYERNQFIVEHYDVVDRICNGVINKVCSQFHRLMREDISGYVMEGIIVAIDRANMNNEHWRSYLYKYGYIFALNGAMEIYGYTRSRTKGQSHYERIPVTYVEQRDLDKVAADPGISNYDEFIEKEYIWFKRFLRNSVESIALECLMNRMKLRDISQKLSIPARTLHRVFKRLQMIYQLVCANEPYEHLLTIYHSGKRQRRVPEGNGFNKKRAPLRVRHVVHMSDTGKEYIITDITDIFKRDSDRMMQNSERL